MGRQRSTRFYIFYTSLQCASVVDVVPLGLLNGFFITKRPVFGMVEESPPTVDKLDASPFKVWGSAILVRRQERRDGRLALLRGDAGQVGKARYRGEHPAGVIGLG
jgi:hypothetical protein